ncbi:MAG: hypothetical protein JWP11_1048 [Frankiales bacterium]|nr:hypothetical protein [Frankiales bacterium]
MTQADSRISVDPVSVQRYGASAQEKFEHIRNQLVAMVSAVATVDYEGPNASQFKKECAELTADFSARLLKDLGTIADAVRASTSNIAGSLGGQPINIQVNGTPVPMPAIKASDGVVVANLPHLEALIPSVQGKFVKLNEALTHHLTELRNTVWTGQAKSNAVEAVTRFTHTATNHADEAKKSITDFIQKQVDSTRAQDH